MPMMIYFSMILSLGHFLLLLMMPMMGSANACPSPLPGEEGSDTEQMRSRRGCNIVLRDGGDMLTMAWISMVSELEQVDKLINNPG